VWCGVVWCGVVCVEKEIGGRKRIKKGEKNKKWQVREGNKKQEDKTKSKG
jgi:hypothetical protein